MCEEIELNTKTYEWTFSLGKRTGNDVLFHVLGAPNRFQRWMQKIVLGIYWEKEDD